MQRNPIGRVKAAPKKSSNGQYKYSVFSPDCDGEDGDLELAVVQPTNSTVPSPAPSFDRYALFDEADEHVKALPTVYHDEY